jgi:hypothetical protein
MLKIHILCCNFYYTNLINVSSRRIFYYNTNRHHFKNMCYKPSSYCRKNWVLSSPHANTFGIANVFYMFHLLTFWLCFVCLVHRKVSLVKFSPVFISSYTFLQCFAIICETKSPNRKLSSVKSFKLVETCATNVVLSPWRMFPW